VRLGAFGIQIRSFAKFAFSLVILMAEDRGQNRRPRENPPGHCSIAKHGSPFAPLGWPTGIGVQTVLFIVSKGQAGVCWRVILVKFNGAIQQRDGTVHIVREVPALQVSLGLGAQGKKDYPAPLRLQRCLSAGVSPTES